MGWLFAMLSILACAAHAVAPSTAGAAEGKTPPTLWTRCATSSEVDIACSIPRGIGADPGSGHIFVADQFNRRMVEFTASGVFLRTWGWDVVASGPDNAGTGFEICVPANGDTCKAGVLGSGAGQLGPVQGVAVDSGGNIYVIDFDNRRVQKFDPEGHFLLMLGGEVNKSKVEAAAPEAEQNVCVATSGDVCQAGSEGAGNGQFGEWKPGSFIAIDTNASESTSDDLIYVGDQDRIQVFDAGGHYIKSLPLPGKTVQSLAADSSGSLYAIYNGQVDVRKLTPTGEELASPRFKVVTPEEKAIAPTAVTVDSLGDVYAFGPTQNGDGFPLNPIYEFDADGKQIANFGEGEFNASTGMATNVCPGDEAPGNLYVSNASSGNPFLRAYGPEPKNCGKAISLPATNITETAARLNGKANPKGQAVSECFFEYGTTLTYGQTASCVPAAGELGSGNEPVPVHANISSLTKGTVYHFRLVVGTASGSEESSDETFKTLGPPVVSDEAASNIAYTEAMLKALVNPEGFATRYHFEYGVEDAHENSTPEIEVGSDRANHAALANLAGLTPGTAYHWRIVATNSSGTAEGEEHIFTTYLEPSAAPCPNDAFRTGSGAALPDCRAYEMVSPVDKNGGDFIHEFEAYVQTAPDGNKLTYSAAPAFGDVQASVALNQYLASRDPKAGWSNHGIHPPVVGEHPVAAIFFGLFREFQAFSSDLCSAWFEDVLSPPLTREGQDGYVNLYRLDLCGEEEPEALTSTPPPPSTEEAYVNRFGQSVASHSDAGTHALFAAKAALTPEAAVTTNPQIYDRFGGTLHLVSIKPNGSTDAGFGFTGAGVGGSPVYNLDNAVSSDGSRVYWSSGLDESSGIARQIFLRENPGEEQSTIEGGKCIEPTKACTVLAANGGLLGVFFWGAASDGSGALVGKGENAEELTEFSLARFEADSKKALRTVATHVKGVLGESDDLSHIYFVSTDALTPGQKNSEGEEAQAGKPNLYLDEEGTKTFIGTLVSGDVDVNSLAYNLISIQPYRRATRVSPDGGRLVFQSRAPLTGYDNTDPSNGEADVEVFTYQAGGALNCVSCSPGGARPSGVEMHEPYVVGAERGRATHVFAAAWIQTWEHPLYASHVLSDDGSRLFFNSYVPLVPADTNGAMDVYEWEAPGAGSCSEESHAFHKANGGCLYLISSGESSFESEFWDASPDGSNVFFSTESSLVPKDPGSVDLYDARVEGGFPEPSGSEECEGEACQSPPLAPQDATPGSASYQGPGNVNEEGAKPCPKGKRKVRQGGKTRCVKQHKGKGRHRKASHDRRAAR